MSEENIDKHVCMGLNSCKNLGYTGNNDCAGQGDCSTAVGHPCHTLNSCKGEGGCGIFGTTEEFCHPGQNECKYQGSCGVPILNSRFIAQGPNKGRSVWVLARARFEEKRQSEGKKYGPSPLPYGPTNEFLIKQRTPADVDPKDFQSDYSSCAQSGSRNCSYAVGPIERAQEAEARVLKINKESAAKIADSISVCPNLETGSCAEQ